jgi:hypothetical protein
MFIHGQLQLSSTNVYHTHYWIDEMSHVSHNLFILLWEQEAWILRGVIMIFITADSVICSHFLQWVVGNTLVESFLRKLSKKLSYPLTAIVSFASDQMCYNTRTSRLSWLPEISYSEIIMCRNMIEFKICCPPKLQIFPLIWLHP